MYELYTAPTPNGHKVSCTLEAMQLPYDVRFVDIFQGEQHAAEFRRLNPNGRIPVLVDPDEDNFAIFESGAIMLYLAEKHRQLLPEDVKGKSLVTQWLMFQMAGIGPMMGQANVFYRYFPEKLPTAINRYQNECRRLFEVLDHRLAESEWLAGEFSIADIANWCWVRTYKWSGIDRSDLVNLDRWLDAMKALPAMQRGVQVPITTPNLDNDVEAGGEFVRRAQSMLQR